LAVHGDLKLGKLGINAMPPKSGKSNVLDTINSLIAVGVKLGEQYGKVRLWIMYDMQGQHAASHTSFASVCNKHSCAKYALVVLNNSERPLCVYFAANRHVGLHSSYHRCGDAVHKASASSGAAAVWL